MFVEWGSMWRGKAMARESNRPEFWNLVSFTLLVA